MNAYNHETSPLNTPTAETAKILVIRFTSMGDVVLSSVLCNSLKKTFPKARIDYLVYDESAGLFELHPYVDQVVALSQSQRKNPFKYWRKIRQITAEGYDLVVDAQSTSASEFISLFARKRAICIGRVQKGRGLFYTNIVNANAGGGNKLSERLRLLEPLVAMGFDVKYDDDVVINTPMSLKNEVRADMESAGINFNRPVFMMSVASQESDKSWSLDNMAIWGKYAIDSYDAQLILIAGSAEEQVKVDAVYEAMGKPSDVYPRINTDSLSKLTALMSHCDLFLGNEGGARHLAQACHLPSAVVCSPSVKRAGWLPKESRLHQGVCWEDVVSLSQQDQYTLNANSKTDRDHYRELYNLISVDHAIEVLDSVANEAGVTFKNA